ncbi:unnamed protein product [Effrenium voratum]|nr:unnamed protein product [Effrenium voratum]
MTHMAIGINPQRLQQVLSYLPANEAFGAAKVSQTFQKVQASLDAGLFLSQIRPGAWLRRNDLDQEFNRRLLRDWHLCLRDSAMQVAYVDYRQHLVYVEPSCSLAASPQGQDPFPVSADRPDYCCSIEPFNSNCLWWDCLQGELFDWPRVEHSDAQVNSPPAPHAVAHAGYQPAREMPVEMPFELEAVPGYNGSLAAPKLQDDVLGILSLNAAWFFCSFWTRQLQGIFLLRDGRFLLVGSCEMQGTIDSQAQAKVYRGFVANSLLSLVTFAQDPRSREILRTRLPLGQDDRGVKPTELAVKIPRVQHDTEDFEKRFGPFLRASKSCDTVLFSTSELNHEGCKHLRAGDRVRVLRRGDMLIWSSCWCEDWAAPQGAVSPQLDTEYLERASQEDLHFSTFPGGCHLGLRTGSWYDAEVVHVNADNTLDLKYTNPGEWSNGASFFTDSQGNDRNEAPIEADVAIERAKLLPTSRWYWAFQDVWKGCGCFSSVSMSFADGGGRSGPGFANNTSEDAKAGDSNAARFLKLADVFADTAEAHRFRFMTLFEEKDMLAGKDRHSIEELHSTASSGFPREAHMALGKRLFLQLLRTSFWEKWTVQGGESPSKISNVLQKDAFLRLIVL